MSVFIGRTIFSLVKNYRIRVLIGYSVFLTIVENRIVILLTSWPQWRDARKGYFAFMSKRRTVFRGKNETGKRTALTHYLSQITKK